MKMIVPLSKPQITKVENMQTVTVNPKSKMVENYLVDIADSEIAHELFRSLLNGNSYKLDGKYVSDVENYSGDGIKSAFKKLGKDIKKGFTQAGDAMKETAFDVNHALKSDRTAKAIVKGFVPVASGEIAGMLAEGGVTYLTGVPQLGKAVGKATNKGVTKGTETALKTEGYGLTKVKKGKIQPMLEGGSVTMEQVKDLLPQNEHIVANDPKLNAKVRRMNAVEKLANNPQLAQNTSVKMEKPKVNIRMGKGLKGFGKGLSGYGK